MRFLMFHCNCVTIVYRFRDIMILVTLVENRNVYTPPVFNAAIGISPRSIRNGKLESWVHEVVKNVGRYSEPFPHNTIQTFRRRHQWKSGLSPHFIVPLNMKCPMEKWTKSTFFLQLFLGNLFLSLSPLVDIDSEK